MWNSNSLSKRKIARLTKRGYYPDGSVPGLFFQISASGGRSFVYRYTLNRRQRMMGLRCNDDLDVARQRAKDANALVWNGIDPLEVRRDRGPTRSAIAFKEVGRLYITAHKPGWKNEKHAAQWEATLEAYVYPNIGDKSVDEIDTPEVLKLLEKIWTNVPETASRVRQRVEAIFDYARASGFRKLDNNPARWRGHLDKLLPARTKIAKPEHHPALPHVTLPSFFANLRSREGISAKALQFLILTSARTAEVTSARRNEIDWNAKTWTVPAERMKAKRPHIVPLSGAAIELLKALPVEDGNQYLFIGTRAGQPISNAAMAELMKDIAAPSTTPDRIAVPHGFRSTFRDWCGECTNFPRELAESALAHTIKNKAEAAYARGAMVERRRKLMQAWTAYCTSPVRSGDVVPIRKSAAI